MHIGSALLVGIASFMSRHCSSVCPSICLSVNFSCPLHISFINRQVLFIQCLNGSPYRDNVKNSYISPAQCAPRSQFEVKVQLMTFLVPGRVAQSVGHLTRKSGVLGSISGLATYFRFSFRFYMKGNCQLLAKVCARRTG